jgi:hypothetical protein
MTINNIDFIVILSYLSAYLSVLRVFSHDDCAGDMLAIIHVLEFPVKDSFSICVNLLCLNGLCLLSWSIDRIHSFSWKNKKSFKKWYVKVDRHIKHLLYPYSEMCDTTLHNMKGKLCGSCEFVTSLFTSICVYI